MSLHSPLHSSKQLWKIWIGKGEGGRGEGRDEGMRDARMEGRKRGTRREERNEEEREERGGREVHPLMVGVPNLGH